MALLRYTLLRVLIFAVLAALLWLAGLRGYLLLLAAVALSGVASVFILRGSRDRLSIALDHRMSAIKDRLAERTRVEDAWSDAQREQRTAEQQGLNAPSSGADAGRVHPSRGYVTGMTEDRRTKETPTPGEDPREIDRERTTGKAVDDIAAQEGLVHPQRRVGATGASTDAPGRDLGDLDDAPEVERNREVS